MAARPLSDATFLGVLVAVACGMTLLSSSCAPKSSVTDGGHTSATADGSSTGTTGDDTSTTSMMSTTMMGSDDTGIPLDFPDNETEGSS